MNASRSNELNQVTDYLNYSGSISTKNKSKEFFNCVRNWSYGRNQTTLGDYTSKLNFKVTEFQRESIEKLVRADKYESLSAFLRKAVNELLLSEHHTIDYTKEVNLNG